ncbi:hypothetical protein [Fictibacillus sp. FJAT-27399]|uniref:hypothetical protein n=1 Tax=Fictibacillus sp. FJAT-27399 TaxID=1729689 RepID=UPI0012E3F802|nr:hypothetical protein [Fictibacillus sp. FJAT-27399]
MSYTDASVQGKKAILSFMIIFEDKSKVYKRIVIDESDNNIAEAAALSELVSFLKYYNLDNGLILFDSDALKHMLKKNSNRLCNRIPISIKKDIIKLNIRTQVIPRPNNLAHKICYKDKYIRSQLISKINRMFFHKVADYPDLFMQLSVFDEFKQYYNKRLASFHEAQMNLNHKIWLGDLIEDLEGVKVYQIHDRKIMVIGNTIVKISKVNYVQIGSHWRVMRKRKRFKKMLE